MAKFNLKFSSQAFGGSVKMPVEAQADRDHTPKEVAERFGKRLTDAMNLKEVGGWHVYFDDIEPADEE